ncbi:transcription factor hap5a family protein, putative, partial [Ichthyophthirius multifiliis]
LQQQIKGLKLQSVRNYNCNQKMILIDQQLVQQQIINPNFNFQQQNILTQIIPLFDVSSHQQYLDTGKFKKFFEVIEELGRGGFGRVYKAMCKVEQKIYAIKQIAVPFEPGQNPTEHKYYREVKSMNSLNHPNIVSYNTSWWEECDDDMMNQLQLFIQNQNISNASSFEAQVNNNKSNHHYQISNEKTSNNYNESVQVSCIEWEQTNENKNNLNESQSNSQLIDKITKMESDSQDQYYYQEQQQSKYSAIHITKQSKILALFIQFEYCSGKTLRNYFEESKAFKYITIKQNNKNRRFWVIHIKKRKIHQENYNEQHLPELNKQNSLSNIHTGNVGTPFYMPPEQQNMTGYYDEKIDVYSLGIILLEIIYKMQTYHERLITVNQLKEKRQLPNELYKEYKYAYLEVFRGHQLPLARVKKIMKSDEDVRMISAEAPVLFAKACEIFIIELTHRAWLFTEEGKRRTLQKNDIAACIYNTEIFDFLIDVVPKEDVKQNPYIQNNQQELLQAQNPIGP